MITLRSSTVWSPCRELSLRQTGATLLGVVLTVALAACGEGNILEPSSKARVPVATHASIVVTPNYSAFTTRAEFNGVGAIDHLNGFEDVTGELVYDVGTPYTALGVTYTSDLNTVLMPGIGLGVSSNSMSTEFGAPLTATLGSTDAFTMFGADLTLIGEKTPVGLVVTTNLGSYAFPNLDVPLATTGQKFFGIALSTPGEYLTGFRLTVGGPGTGMLLDNVAVGHVAAKKNADPDASSGGPYTGSEGSSISYAFSATDADGDALTFSWDLGDGTKGSGPVPPSAHTYADNGSYAVMLAVDDGRGGVDTARTTANITNVAPKLAGFSIPSAPIALISGSVNLPVATSFTDPGTADTFIATLDCGSGITAQSSAPNGMAGGVCAFSEPGVYAIQLTVRDDDGGSDTKLASGQVVIYEPAGGWVTGGGWIVSPLGANTIAPTTTGKLTFGFVARYQPGSTIPTGNAEFKLNVGKLDFRSTSLEWLVVGDTKAQLQGRGTVNGGGDYAFLVIAFDGGSGDAVRIRIWQRVSGAVVYDSRPGEPFDAETLTALGGGSVQLHQH
jgi:hypothetical protein